MMAKKLLVVAVHPDDETLGAGGTLLAAKAAGHQTGWLVVTHMSQRFGWSTERIAERDAEVACINETYGFDYFRNLGMEPAGLDKCPLSELVSTLRNALEEWRPETVILPYWEDAHSDHQLVFQAAKSCLKKFRAPYLKRVYAMEVISETNYSFPLSFKPNWYNDISSHLDAKVAAMNVYKSELRAHPFPRSEKSLRALATLRGSEANCQYAESFVLMAAYDALI